MYMHDTALNIFVRYDAHKSTVLDAHLLKRFPAEYLYKCPTTSIPNNVHRALVLF